jgi:transposase-like protein
MSITIKPRRIFSKELKKEIVGRIEQGAIRVREVCREYRVSPSAVYNWINEYSLNLKKGEILVIQKESEEQKNIELRKRIAELERIVGQKQMEVDFLNKIIELGSEEVKMDIKKKFGGKQSPGSNTIEGNTAGK